MMSLRAIRVWRGVVLAVCLSLPAGFTPARGGDAPASADLATYQRKLALYAAARQKYEAAADAYWNSIAAKRRMRAAKRRAGEPVVLDDYVLTQPPVYSGPPKPVDPSAPTKETVAPPDYVPVVADFLKSAQEHFNFIPRRPQRETDYKRAYVKVAAAAGLSKDQVVRVYAFESGGNGRYDVQAGLESGAPGARAITTALGYNQLLATNSLELLAEKGDQFIRTLQAKAAALPEAERAALDAKIATLRRMVEFSRTVPDDWSAHDNLANTPKGLSLHALILDLDVGPLLQAQKILDSVLFARKRGHAGHLSAAELEMMNLTGDGNGFDMIAMGPDMRDRVPTANFFRRDSYQRNPVAVRNNVVAKLLAATDATMDREAKLAGARDMAAGFAQPSP
jgi:hypothetical protein